MRDTDTGRKDSETERKIGDRYLLNQELTLSEAAYKASLELDNKNIKALNNLGVLHEKLGQPEKAVELYRRACSQIDDSIQTPSIYYKNLARICRSMKDINLALWAYEKAVSTETPISYDCAVGYLELLSGANVPSDNKQTLNTLEKILTNKKVDLELLSHIFFRSIITTTTIDTSHADWTRRLVSHLSTYKSAFYFLTTHLITNPTLANLIELSHHHLNEINAQQRAWMSAVIKSQHHLEQLAFNKHAGSHIATNKGNRSDTLIKIARGQNKTLNKLLHSNPQNQLRSFYEANPYPQWMYLPHHEPTTINEYFFRTGITTKIKSSTNIKILIAGCGTGRHAIQMALNYPQAQVIGIDISSSSLRYANTMKEQHDINNVSFVQCSIFDVSDLNMKFHIIECIGVLHHIKQPSRAIRALLSTLSKKGLLKLGLYSKLARAPIESLKEKCRNHKIAYSPENLLSIRKLAANQYADELKSIIWSKDFYSYQGCMDLLFNPYEDSYTPRKIYNLLRANNLDFCGFEINSISGPKFTKFNSADELSSLFLEWHRFELKNPSTFSNMYLFWVKPRNANENLKLQYRS